MHGVTVIVAAALAAAACVVAVAGALFAADRVGASMERRGWIYWRKRRPPAGGGPGGGGLSGVLTDFQQIVEPQVRHVIEDREERRLVRLSHSADGAAGDDTKRLDDRPGAGV